MSVLSTLRSGSRYRKEPRYRYNMSRLCSRRADVPITWHYMAPQQCRIPYEMEKRCISGVLFDANNQNKQLLHTHTYIHTYIPPPHTHTHIYIYIYIPYLCTHLFIY